GAVAENPDALAGSGWHFPFGVTNHAKAAFKPLAVIGRRHLSTGTHRPGLQLAFSGPLADEVAQPLLLRTRLSRRRLSSRELSGSNRYHETCGERLQCSSHVPSSCTAGIELALEHVGQLEARQSEPDAPRGQVLQAGRWPSTASIVGPDRLEPRH